MADARHPKQYPRGPKFPKLQITDEWLDLVRQKLERHRLAGRFPGNQRELSKAIGADEGGLGRVLKGEQRTYKYTRKICEVLEVPLPMVANPAVTPDEWDDAVALARSLPPTAQRRALLILKAALVPDDET